MEKTPAEQNMIRSRLRKNQLLAGLSPEAIELFVEYTELRTVERDTVVIEQGARGDEFFIAEKGGFNFSVGGSAPMPLQEESFGELALLFNAPRSATITAYTDARLWVLDRATFRTGVRASAAKRRAETVKALKKVKLLETLTAGQFENLADAVHPQGFEEGAEVFRKGAKGDVFYLIIEGTFEMKDITGVSERITKSAGDFFGEMALLTGEPRSATVVASTKARCLALEKADFDRVVGPLKQLIAMHEHKTMLTNIPILKNLSEMERTNAVRRFKLVTYKRGAVIVKQGAAGDRFFVIGSGSVTVTRAEAPDFVAEFSPGQFFGELALLNPADKRSATVTAKTECACYYLTRQAFAQVVVGELGDIIKKTADERIKASMADSSGGLGMEAHEKIPFEELKTVAVLGAGTFGRVSLVQNAKNEKQVFALKALHKSEIVMHKQEANTMNEKNIMIMCQHPFILRLFDTYKDAHRLYMLLEFCPGGELFTVLHTPTKDGVTPAAAKFYCAGVAMALGYLSDRDIMYRDLKPENMLVDIKGYPKVIDFGFAKVCPGKTYTLCGTPEYMAPEIILGRGYDKGVDWWAFGVLLYECIAGYSPFCDPNGSSQNVICQNIVAGRLRFPKGFDVPTKDFLRGLLAPQSASRPGMGPTGSAAVLDNPYFDKFDFASYTKREMKAPWLPPVKSITDASNFDPFDVDNTIDMSYKDKTDWDKDF